MSVVSFKCPACGAPLIFDPEQGTYACEYCESTYTQAQLDALEQKQVEKEEVLEDFKLIDFTLISSAVSSADA